MITTVIPSYKKGRKRRVFCELCAKKDQTESKIFYDTSDMYIKYLKSKQPDVKRNIYDVFFQFDKCFQIKMQIRLQATNERLTHCSIMDENKEETHFTRLINQQRGIINVDMCARTHLQAVVFALVFHTDMPAACC